MGLKVKYAILSIVSLSVGLVFLTPQKAAAFSGPGYYSGVTTCTTNYLWQQTCSGTTSTSISASQNNVIYPSGIPLTSSSTKIDFYNWLAGQAGTAGGQFIMDTMIGSHDTNTLYARLTDPSVTMTYVVGGQPANYGSVSVRGQRQDGTGAADYFFIGGYAPTARDLLVFSSNGNVVYVIEVACANPVGGLPGLFTTNGIANISKNGGALSAGPITAQPGDTLRWMFWIGNQGTARSFYSNMKKSGFPASSGWNSIIDPQINGVVGTYGTRAFGYAVPGLDSYATYNVTAGDMGSTICEWTEWLPYAYYNMGPAASNQACAVIQYPTAYTLTPTASVSTSTVAAGQTVGVTYTVQNVQSGGSQSNLTYWGLREVTIPAGTATPSQFNSYIDNSLGCPTFVSYGGGITCNEISTSTTSGFTTAQQFAGSPGGTTTTLTTSMLNSPSAANIAMFNNITIPAGTAPGTRICRVLSVNPRDQGSLLAGETYHNRDSAVGCVLVASSPYVAIVGGDAWAGGSIISPYSGVGTFRGDLMPGFGSFGEYGILATGSVNYFGSAGALGAVSSATGNVSGPLTFANASSLGSFSSMHQITDLGAQYAGAANTPGVLNSSNQIAASGVYKATGDITLNTSIIGPAATRAVIYAPNNTVTIAGNITYNSTGATTFIQVPSLVIVAKNIQINGAVQRVDASLYATNSFVSCTEGPRATGASAAITTTGACRNPLVINGSLSVAQQAVGSTVFNRSFGGQAAGQPAEMIKMRPEVYVTPYEVNSQPSSAILRTVEETELPARY